MNKKELFDLLDKVIDNIIAPNDGDYEALIRRAIDAKYILYTLFSKKIVDKDSDKGDSVNHPAHYTKHPSGYECIDITRHYCFSIGNAIKYLWRAGLKKDAELGDKQKEIEDLKKAIWYINDRIKQLENKI